jgi:hypothetical protein
MVEPAPRIPEGASGREVAAIVRTAAAEAGVPLVAFLAPVSKHAQTWIYQLGIARLPKPHTIARVEALLRGDPVPPPPINNFQKSGDPRPPFHVAHRGPPAASIPPRIAPRDPCPRCGVRADYGCRHSRAPLGMGAFA